MSGGSGDLESTLQHIDRIQSRLRALCDVKSHSVTADSLLPLVSWYIHSLSSSSRSSSKEAAPGCGQKLRRLRLDILTLLSNLSLLEHGREILNKLALSITLKSIDMSCLESDERLIVDSIISALSVTSKSSKPTTVSKLTSISNLQDNYSNAIANEGFNDKINSNLKLYSPYISEMNQSDIQLLKIFKQFCKKSVENQLHYINNQFLNSLSRDFDFNCLIRQDIITNLNDMNCEKANSGLDMFQPLVASNIALYGKMQHFFALSSTTSKMVKAFENEQYLNNLHLFNASFAYSQIKMIIRLLHLIYNSKPAIIGSLFCLLQLEIRKLSNYSHFDSEIVDIFCKQVREENLINKFYNFVSNKSVLSDVRIFGKAHFLIFCESILDAAAMVSYKFEFNRKELENIRVCLEDQIIFSCLQLRKHKFSRLFATLKPSEQEELMSQKNLKRNIITIIKAVCPNVPICAKQSTWSFVSDPIRLIEAMNITEYQPLINNAIYSLLFRHEASFVENNFISLKEVCYTFSLILARSTNGVIMSILKVFKQYVLEDSQLDNSSRVASRQQISEAFLLQSNIIRELLKICIENSSNFNFEIVSTIQNLLAQAIINQTMEDTKEISANLEFIDNLKTLNTELILVLSQHSNNDLHCFEILKQFVDFVKKNLPDVFLITCLTCLLLKRSYSNKKYFAEQICGNLIDDYQFMAPLDQFSHLIITSTMNSNTHNEFLTKFKAIAAEYDINDSSRIDKTKPNYDEFSSLMDLFILDTNHTIPLDTQINYLERISAILRNKSLCDQMLTQGYLSAIIRNVYINWCTQEKSDEFNVTSKVQTKDFTKIETILNIILNISMKICFHFKISNNFQQYSLAMQRFLLISCKFQHISRTISCHFLHLTNYMILNQKSSGLSENGIIIVPEFLFKNLLVPSQWAVGSKREEPVMNPYVLLKSHQINYLKIKFNICIQKLIPCIHGLNSLQNHDKVGSFFSPKLMLNDEENKLLTIFKFSAIKSSMQDWLEGATSHSQVKELLSVCKIWMSVSLQTRQIDDISGFSSTVIKYLGKYYTTNPTNRKDCDLLQAINNYILFNIMLFSGSIISDILSIFSQSMSKIAHFLLDASQENQIFQNLYSQLLYTVEAAILKFDFSLTNHTDGENNLHLYQSLSRIIINISITHLNQILSQPSTPSALIKLNYSLLALLKTTLDVPQNYPVFAAVEQCEELFAKLLACFQQLTQSFHSVSCSRLKSHASSDLIISLSSSIRSCLILYKLHFGNDVSVESNSQILSNFLLKFPVLNSDELFLLLLTKVVEISPSDEASILCIDLFQSIVYVRYRANAAELYPTEADENIYTILKNRLLCCKNPLLLSSIFKLLGTLMIFKKGKPLAYFRQFNIDYLKKNLHLSLADCKTSQESLFCNYLKFLKTIVCHALPGELNCIVENQSSLKRALLSGKNSPHDYLLIEIYSCVIYKQRALNFENLGLILKSYVNQLRHTKNESEITNLPQIIASLQILLIGMIKQSHNDVWPNIYEIICTNFDLLLGNLYSSRIELSLGTIDSPMAIVTLKFLCNFYLFADSCLMKLEHPIAKYEKELIDFLVGCLDKVNDILSPFFICLMDLFALMPSKEFRNHKAIANSNFFNILLKRIAEMISKIHETLAFDSSAAIAPIVNFISTSLRIVLCMIFSAKEVQNALATTQFLKIMNLLLLICETYPRLQPSLMLPTLQVITASICHNPDSCPSIIQSIFCGNNFKKLSKSPRSIIFSLFNIISLKSSSLFCIVQSLDIILAITLNQSCRSALLRSTFLQSILKMKPNYKSLSMCIVSKKKLDIALALSYYQECQTHIFNCAYFWDIISEVLVPGESQFNGIYPLENLLIFYKNISNHSLLSSKLTSSPTFMQYIVLCLKSVNLPIDHYQLICKIIYNMASHSSKLKIQIQSYHLPQLLNCNAYKDREINQLKQKISTLF